MITGISVLKIWICYESMKLKSFKIFQKYLQKMAGPGAGTDIFSSWSHETDYATLDDNLTNVKMPHNTKIICTDRH
jgi:ABC-type enterochelin transport system ATPase subunit